MLGSGKQEEIWQELETRAIGANAVSVIGPESIAVLHARQCGSRALEVSGKIHAGVGFSRARTGIDSGIRLSNVAPVFIVAINDWSGVI